MKLSSYIGGIIGLTKGLFRLVFELLKRPHYVAVLIALFFGVFYLYGVPPQEVAGVIGEKWQAFVEDRKQVFSEEMQSLTERLGVEGNPLLLATQPSHSVTGSMSEEDYSARIEREKREAYQARMEQEKKRQFEESFGWQKAYASLDDKGSKLKKEGMIHGRLTVVGADKVSIEGRTFSLKVSLRSGKAGEAFYQLKKRFDGAEAYCRPEPENVGFADCFVADTDVSGILTDFGYADPI